MAGGKILRVTLRGPGGKEVALEPGTHVIGRGNTNWPIEDKRCSRRQAELNVSSEDVKLVVHGVNPTYLTRCRSGKTISVVKEKANVLKNGDIFTLIVDEHPFTIQIERSEPAAPKQEEKVGEKWRCAICTFANAPAHEKCAMCDTPKDLKKSTKRKVPFGDDEGSTKKKPAKDEEDERPLCQYGAKCYRKNPEHFKEYRHPDKEKPQSAKRKRNEEESVHTPKQTKAAKMDEDHKAASAGDAVEKKPSKSTNKKGKEKAKPSDSNDQKKLKTLRVVPRKSGYKIAEAAKMGLVKEDDESQDMEEESRPIKKLLPHTATTLKAAASKTSEAKEKKIHTDSTPSVQSPPSPQPSGPAKPSIIKDGEWKKLKGAHCLAFPSLSTATSRFDNTQARDVIIAAVSEFLKKHQEEDLHLYLVLHPSEQSLIALFKEQSDTLQDERFRFIAGDITHLVSQTETPACFIANETNWRMKCAGSGVSKMIYERAGPGLAIETKEHYSVAQVGQAYPVALPSSSPLYQEEEVRVVIHCLGPNMNDARPDSLRGDYDKGNALLEETYRNLFECFYGIAYD